MVGHDTPGYGACGEHRLLTSPLSTPVTTFFRKTPETRRKIKRLSISTISIVTVIFYFVNIIRKTNHLFHSPTSQKFIAKSPSIFRLESWRCEALKSHSSGHWHHEYAPVKNYSFRSDDEERTYFPDEIQWLQGENIPSAFDKKTCKTFQQMHSGIMYVTKLGKQCGCGLPEFKPSLSTWVYNDTVSTESSKTEVYGLHSSRQLAHGLANTNRHLCFVGDSIDLNIYDALQVNLLRSLKLQQLGQKYYDHPLISVDERQFDVNISRTDNGVEYVPKGWRTMSSIRTTEVVFHNINGVAKFSYFSHYGWSPWDIELLENCSIVVMNLGLHYHASSGNAIRTGNSLSSDVRAAITALVNFTATKKDRIAIWRSALPQHFQSTNGHYGNHNKSGCVPLKISFREQVYNVAYDAVFDEMCQTLDGVDTSCSPYEKHCTVNIREKKHQTTYQFRISNNLTTWVDERDNPVKKGTIFRWNIADLFDNHLWHHTIFDCSHYCYVPQLFDEAFKRLELLLRNN